MKFKLVLLFHPLTQWFPTFQHTTLPVQSESVFTSPSLATIVTLYQWFSTFLVEQNSNETFQRLEEPLCGNLIVLCQGGPTSALLWATFQNYSSLQAVTG